MPPENTVPQVVKNINIEGKDKGFVLSWDMPDKNSDGSRLSDLAGFKLYRRAGDNCKACSDDLPLYIDIDLDAPEGANVESKKITFVDSELEKGITYYYRVAPYNKGGYFGDFSEILKGQWITPPLAPVKLRGSSSDKTVSLVWEASQMEKGHGFRIYRRRADSEYPGKPVNEKIIKTLAYTDIGLENNSQYFYIVKSVIDVEGTFIEGPPSGEVMLIPIDLMPPATPSNLSAVSGVDRINLYWDESDDYDLLGYNIYRKKKKDLAMTRINSEPLRNNIYTDSDVIKGESYQYSISSIDNSPQGNESPPSQTIKVLVPE